MLFLLFELDGQSYALDTARVAEVLPLVAIRPLPRAPAAIAGVIDYRGAAVPVIDLTELALGRPAVRRLSTRIVLLEHRDRRGTERLLGLIVERATRTLDGEAEQFAALDVNPAGAPYLGPMASLPGGLVQRVQPDDLLSPEACEALFQSVSEP